MGLERGVRPRTPERRDNHYVVGLPNPMLIRQVVAGGSPIRMQYSRNIYANSQKIGVRWLSYGGHGTSDGRFRGSGKPVANSEHASAGRIGQAVRR